MLIAMHAKPAKMRGWLLQRDWWLQMNAITNRTYLLN
jgi:hypothetical protein